MNQVLISTIIPVYNAEKYLRQTLDSLVKQTLPEIEIICVDDGSLDHSVEIIEEYCARDCRVKCLQQKNQGAGAARNHGLEHACGEYVHFLDADDYMALDAYEKLYAGAKRFDADMVKARTCGIDENTGKQVFNKLYDLSVIRKKDFNRVLCFENEPDRIIGKVAVVPWNGIYRRQLLIEKHIRFNTLHCVNDRSFYVHVLIESQRYVLLPDTIAYHRVNLQTSLVGQRAKYFECHFDSYKIIEDLCQFLPSNSKRLILNEEYKDILSWYKIYRNNPGFAERIESSMMHFMQVSKYNPPSKSNKALEIADTIRIGIRALQVQGLFTTIFYILNKYQTS